MTDGPGQPPRAVLGSGADELVRRSFAAAVAVCTNKGTGLARTVLDALGAGIRCAMVAWGAGPDTTGPKWARIERFGDLMAETARSGGAGERHGLSH